ncbi:MAG: iron ABC transporter permease [Oligoflexales bacterium]|nr:iron ABC transporter permease [Oligoflexales bacterium]
MVFYKGLIGIDPALLSHLFETVFPNYLANSLFVLSGTLFFSLLLGIVSAFLVSHFDFTLKRYLDFSFLLPLVFPPYLVAIVYRELLGHFGPVQNILRDWLMVKSPQGWFIFNIESRCGLVFVMSMTLYPYVYLLARAMFGMGSHTYIEVARSGGVSFPATVCKIIIPLSLPAILAGAVIVMTECLSDYGASSLLAVDTITVGIYKLWFSLNKVEIAFQAAVIVLSFVLFVLGVFFIFIKRRHFHNPVFKHHVLRNERITGIKGALAFLFCLLPVFAGFMIPMTCLLLWAASVLGSIDLSLLLLDTGTSVTLGVSSAAVCMIFGTVFAFSGRNIFHNGIFRFLPESLILTMAFPAIVVAVGILALSTSFYDTALGKWFLDSILILVFACSAMFVGLAFFTARSGMEKIPLEIDRALASLSRGKIFSLLFIHIPMTFRMILAGGLFVFVESVKELTMTMVLRPFGYNSLATRIFSYASIDLSKKASLWAIPLVLVCIYPVISVGRKMTAIERE